MTGFLNDQKKDELVILPFNTNAADGSSVNPTVNGTAYANEGTATAQITAGVTAVFAVGGVAGKHQIQVDTTDAAYSPEEAYSIHIDGMTIDGIAGINYSVGVFNLRAQSIDDIYGTGLIRGKWTWSTNTAATDPTDGFVKADNATYSSITEVYISQSSLKGFNAAAIIESLQPGDLLVVAEDKDTANFFDGTVTSAPVDNGTWYTIPIAIADTGGAIPNNNNVDVGFLFARAYLSPDQVKQINYRLQIDGTQVAPAVDAPAQLQVDPGKVASIDGLTGDEAMRVVTASAGGILAGAATTNVTIEGADGSAKTRIDATVDADGNRSAVTLDVTP